MTILPTSRKEAKAQNVKKYNTGKPCPQGHLADRRTDNGACTQCQSNARSELYASGWRQRHNSETAKRKHDKWVISNPRQAWLIRAISRARKRAIASGVPFDISYEYLDSICPNKCPIFGTEFVFLGNKVSRFDSPSLDKIDPQRGYTEGNVAIISMKANVIKQNATSTDIAKVAEWLKLQGY